MDTILIALIVAVPLLILAGIHEYNTNAKFKSMVDAAKATADTDLEKLKTTVGALVSQAEAHATSSHYIAASNATAIAAVAASVPVAPPAPAAPVEAAPAPQPVAAVAADPVAPAPAPAPVAAAIAQPTTPPVVDGYTNLWQPGANCGKNNYMSVVGGKEFHIDPATNTMVLGSGDATPGGVLTPDVSNYIPPAGTVIKTA